MTFAGGFSDHPDLDACLGFAPAKINLTLHVTGQRVDGYHLLDSLVVFADVGDQVTAGVGDALTLAVAGPKGAGLPVGDNNLVLAAARLLAPGRGAALQLEKNLPVASGIGGGSSDAAAAVRVLCDLWHQPLPEPQSLVALGADVPVCLSAQTVRMSGIGEVLTQVPILPEFFMVLANPGVPVSTAAIFRTLPQKANPAMPQSLPVLPNAVALAEWLAQMRNDLEQPARALAPAVTATLSALAAQPGCLFARMSGSGATCFGIFATAPVARAAAIALQKSEPQWWVAPAGVFAGF